MCGSTKATPKKKKKIFFKHEKCKKLKLEKNINSKKLFKIEVRIFYIFLQKEINKSMKEKKIYSPLYGTIVLRSKKFSADPNLKKVHFWSEKQIEPGPVAP